MDKIVGMVLGTEDASPLAFWFSVADSTKVQLDDIIFIRVKDPADEGIDVNFYGIVDEVRRRYEGIQFE
ncbi:MAG TPA: ATP-binding protein, partial [Trueperaceae bacterium]|nr:ATP-binding protein [Trueperaceae bacterium]